MTTEHACGVSPLVDIAASLEQWDFQWTFPDMCKLPEDLDRYESVIAADKPDLLVECGTWRGGSARWFAERGLDVITIDVTAADFSADDRVTQITGDSASPAVAARAAEATRGRRVMVSLDSDHSAAHVAAEIRLYGPLVSAGCHLVVEDGINRWMPRGEHNSPLDAIEELLDGNPEWERDVTTEQMHPVSMYPAGWWIRRG